MSLITLYSRRPRRRTLILLRVFAFSLSQRKQWLASKQWLTLSSFCCLLLARCTQCPHLSSSRHSISSCCTNMRLIVISHQTPRADPRRSHAHLSQVLIRNISMTHTGFYMFVHFLGGHHGVGVGWGLAVLHSPQMSISSHLMFPACVVAFPSHAGAGH